MGDQIRVLCVDDDPDTQDILAAQLQRSGTSFTVTGAESGPEALAALDEGAIDCIVADHDMAEMSGLELLEAVRSRDPDFTFILYTGHGSEGLASEAIAAGVTDYIRKGAEPGRYEILANRIENAVATHRAKRKRREHEYVLDQYRSLVELAGDPMYALDSGGYCLLANDALASFTGYDRDEIEGAHFSEFVSEAEYERATAALKDVAASPTAEQAAIEFTIEVAGEERVGEANVTPVTDDTGEYVGSVGIVRDISTRKERERELAQYERIIETAPVGILVLDEAGEVTWTNDLFVRNLAYSIEDAVGRSFLEFIDDGIFDPEIVERYQEHVRELLSSSNDTDEIAFDVEARTPRAGTRYYEAHTTLLPLEEGEYTGTVTAFRDITQQVQYRSELERQNERLEQFARFVSHDLRNPINVARGHLDLLAESVDDEESLERATWAIDRMETLIDDMLSMARHGQSVETTDALSLEQVAREAWMGVETAAASLEIEDEATFEADPVRLRELLENLFRNAVEHGGQDVTVSVGELDESAGFYVQDDGTGIDEDNRIFEFGYTTLEEGTGFGLGIVQEIAEAHDWEICAETGESAGARFEIAGLEMD